MRQSKALGRRIWTRENCAKQGECLRRTLPAETAHRRRGSDLFQPRRRNLRIRHTRRSLARLGDGNARQQGEKREQQFHVMQRQRDGR